MPFVIAVFSLLFLPSLAWALLPPDVIFNVGSTFIQFFSVAALLVASFFSSIALIAKRWLSFSNKKLIIIFGVIVTITLLAIAIVYVVETKIQQVRYENTISLLQSENDGLQETVANSVSISDYKLLLSDLQNEVPYSISSTTVSDRHFLSDLIVLYGEIDNQIFALELDFNRLEKSPGLFSHYTFLNGVIGDNLFSDYSVRIATTTELVSNSFASKIERVYASDLSPRDIYIGTISVLGKPMIFRIEDLQADFITRNRPAYMQYQSVGSATVQYDGKESLVNALVEGSLSVDYSKHLFFTGRDALEAKVYQFLLWDSEGNFYAIDKTEVISNTPEYPSHAWVLYKSIDGVTKKSFEARIISKIDESGKIAWVIDIPAMGESLKLVPKQPFKQTGEERFRSVVDGSLMSQSGVRLVGGIIHLIE